MDVSFDPMHHLGKALELDPLNTNAAILHAKLLILRGEECAAISFTEKFLARFGPHPNLYNLHALACLKNSRIAEAEESISNALAELPRSKEILHTAFLIKKAKGEKFSAYHFLERIIRIDDQCFETFWEMAKLLDKNSEISKIINLLEIAYSLNCKNFKIFKELVHCYDQQTEHLSIDHLDKQIINDLRRHTQNPFFIKLNPELKKNIVNKLKKLVPS